MALSSIHRASLVSSAITELRDQIEAGTWSVGDRIPSETELAETMGIGRSTVREAVRALTQDGMLEVRHGAGTFVLAARSDAWQPLLRRAAILEVYEVRTGLEFQAARLAAERATADDVERIGAALRARLAVTRSEDADLFVDADLQFHEAVVDAAHNALLSELFRSFVPRLREGLLALRGNSDLDDGTSSQVRDAHVALAEAIAAHDVDAAIAATSGNLDTTTEALRADRTPS